MDGESPKSGPAAGKARQQDDEHRQQLRQIAPKTNQQDQQWKPGDAPTQAHWWAIEALAKAGTLAIIGVYPPTDIFFPIGFAMNKNFTINMGNGNHPRYIPRLLAMVESGVVDPERMVTQHEPLRDVLDAYKQFDLRQPGWLKVALEPAS